MEIELNGKKVPLKVSVLTTVIYEQEFGTDIIKDLFGKVVQDTSNEVVFDYTTTNWTATLKALWAAVKTANPATPPFQEWADKCGDVDLFEVSGVLMPVVMRGLFRATATIIEEQGEESEGKA